jgi:hypothetical protein
MGDNKRKITIHNTCLERSLERFLNIIILVDSGLDLLLLAINQI